jgi:hypothetical protein
MNRKAEAIFELATELAEDPSHSDDKAVATIVKAGGHQPESLRIAEINSRIEGRYLDFPLESRVQRLLESALTGQPVKQPTDDDLIRFAAVGRFCALPDNEKWRQLVSAVPELSELAREAANGAFRIPPEIADPSSEQSARRDAHRKLQTMRSHLNSRLDPIVGPQSGSQNPLVSSASAREFAYGYLRWRSEHPS